MPLIEMRDEIQQIQAKNRLSTSNMIKLIKENDELKRINDALKKEIEQLKKLN